MKRALIGHTGFVGGTLLAAETFTHGFDSSDLQELRGTRFDEVVCAGIPPVQQQSEPDGAAIAALLAVLETVRADRFVLISSTGVYPDPSQPLDESAVPDAAGHDAKGRQSLELEQFVMARFADYAVVRLPALFGDGQQRNALYDLLRDSGVERLNPAARMQWYPTRRLSGDLVRIGAAGLRVVNLVTEPLRLGDIASRLFANARLGPEIEPAPGSDLRTRHAALFGGESPYIMGRTQVLLAMTDFVRRLRRR